MCFSIGFSGYFGITIRPGWCRAQSQLVSRQRNRETFSCERYCSHRSLVTCSKRQKIVDWRLGGPAVEAKSCQKDKQMRIPLFPWMGAMENPRKIGYIYIKYVNNYIYIYTHNYIYSICICICIYIYIRIYNLYKYIYIYIYIQLEYWRMHCIRIWRVRIQCGLHISNHTKHIAL